jgi:hypothetical protein
MSDEFAPDDIFIDIDREVSRYLLGNLAAADGGIAPRQLDNRANAWF